MATLPSASEQRQKADAAALDPTPPSAPPQNPADDKSNKIPAVRFASVNQEISADDSAENPIRTTSSTYPPQIDEKDADQLKEISKSLQGGHLQQQRMNTFQFEAFSLPPSRVPSRDENTPDSTRLSTPNSPGPRDSGTGSPRFPVATPPLTPYGSEPSAVGVEKRARQSSVKSANEPPAITPQPSLSNEKLQHPPLTHRPASSDQVRRATSAEGHKTDDERSHSHRRGMFGGGASVPVSRESSPSRSSASNYYSKPMTPGGDANDPYSKGKRPPQQQNANRSSIDARFLFTRKKKTGSPNSSKIDLSEKRNSGSWASGKTGSEESAIPGPASHHHHHASSMVDLKRFFRKPHHHHHHGQKRDASPAPSMRTGTKTPPASRQPTQQHTPFADDHGLSTKYGKLGKVLGAGAGGSVRLMKRKEDGTVFAVKEFRARHAYETEREYNKKVTAEFCVGSTLHHGNIIETLDILQEKGRWYEVMEYAPFDLFAIVMTGRMTREEVTCCFLQILNGVTYLHSLGLTHRDLKLDNVVVSNKGIMKIIDFGSAHVFKYPFESEPVLARGIVGSDPYLAPEVYDTKEYEASAVDIWSLAIIYCCMTLRRFPWKLPRMSDNSFKLFASDPTPGHDPERLLGPSSAENSDSERKAKKHHSHHHHHSHSQSQAQSRATTNEGSQPSATSTNASTSSQPEKKELIRGPWRILRLLPRDSRRIIWRMLDVNPKTRATMDDILSESWVADTIICQQIENGEVIEAEDHSHILEPPASQSAPPSKA